MKLKYGSQIKIVNRQKQRRQNKFDHDNYIKIIKMRYSTEPRDRTYVKGYGFLSLAKNMGKSLSNKYGQGLLDSTKKFTTDAIKTASKRVATELH